MKALVLTSNTSDTTALREGLGNHFEVVFVNNEAACYEKFKTDRYEFTFLDIDHLSQNIETLKPCLNKYWKAHPAAHLVILAKPENTRLAVKAVKLGADDYLNYPIDKSELDLVTSTICELIRSDTELEYLRDQFWKVELKDVMKTKSPSMSKVYKLIKSVAPTKSTVLLTGETGVGKSMVAKIIHEHSGRQGAPFIPVHCGALSESLVESELFGHEKGSFTGAIQRKLGKFELANGGTIFLDEIGTISTNVQIKLLQVLQEAIFQRVGGESNIKVDVRIIAATNEKLKEMVNKNLFRQDLFHRLNIFPIEIPALRDRKEDIPNILHTLLKRLNREGLKEIQGFRSDALEALVNFDWAGNIRELENVLERAYILEESELITPDSLPFEIVGENAIVVPVDGKKTLAEARNEVLEKFEKQYLEEILAETNGKVGPAADIAGVGPRQIHKMMTKYGVDKSKFSPQNKGEAEVAH